MIAQTVNSLATAPIALRMRKSNSGSRKSLSSVASPTNRGGTMLLTEKAVVFSVIGACLLLLASCDDVGARSPPKIRITDMPDPGVITRFELVHLTDQPGSRLIIYACPKGGKEERSGSIELSSEDAKKVAKARKVKLAFSEQREGKTYNIDEVNAAAR